MTPGEQMEIWPDRLWSGPLEPVDPLDRQDPLNPLDRIEALEDEAWDLRESIEALAARMETLHDENCGRLRRLEGYDF